jgi:hypothetical protein
MKSVIRSVLRFSNAGLLLLAVLGRDASAQLTIAAPVDQAVVNSPFYLQAKAPSCHESPTASMAYSYDQNPDNIFSGSQSVSTMVTIPVNGAHLLRVKAWSTTGSLCEEDVALTVGGGVAVSAPAGGSLVTSPFIAEAQAPTCNGQGTKEMGYSMNHEWDTVFSRGISLDRSVWSWTGPQQILRVKAWGDAGAYCETDVNVSVADSSGLIPPSGVAAYQHLELDNNYTGTYAQCGGAIGPSTSLWQTQPDCGTPGTNAGSTGIVPTPTYGKDMSSRAYTMSYTASGGGVRWFDAKPADDSATHFQYDLNVYLPSVSSVMNIEMDTNHSITTLGKWVYIMATQCDLSLAVWQVTVNRAWVNTNVPCTANQVTPGIWHHLQIQTHHDANGGPGIYYDAIAVDGNVTPITTCTNPSTGAVISCVSTAENLGWGGVIGPNFQLDGQGSGGSAAAYVDDFTIYYW